MRTTQSTRAPILLQEGTATAPDEACPLTGRSDTPCSRQGLQSLRRDDVGELLLPKDLPAPLGDQHSLSFLLFCVLCFFNSGHGRVTGVAAPLTPAEALHSGCETQPERKSLPRPIRIMGDDSDVSSHATLHPADGCEAPTKRAPRADEMLDGVCFEMRTRWRKLRGGRNASHWCLRQPQLSDC